MGTLQHIITMFQKAFDQLQIHVSLQTIENLSILIHKAMTSSSRQYHRMEHVFTLLDSDTPLLSIAALFHDIVYYQVDDGLSFEIKHLLSSSIHEKNGFITLTETIKQEDRMLKLTLDVFDFKPGQQLPPYNGMNEFLSALVMNKTLESYLSESVLAHLTVCIEATIPFRGANEQGQGFPELLEQRLKQIAGTYQIPLDADTRERFIKNAVRFGNKDVEGFAVQDPGKFLDNTWKLLPETNLALRSGELYSIKDYRKAIQKMEGFLRFLDPSRIFHQYKGVPSDEEYRQLTQQALTNLTIAREYLAMKLLAIAVLEALAEVTGGDVPISLFMGDVQREVLSFVSKDLLASGLNVPVSFDPKTPVFLLLDSGRTDEVNFDIQSSPLAAFLYKYLDPSSRDHLLQKARTMFDGQCSSQESSDKSAPLIDARCSAQEFLDDMDPAILAVIAEHCSSKALTRQEQLRPYISHNR